MPFPQYVFSTARQEGGSSPPPPPPAYTTGGVVFDGATSLANAALVATDNALMSFSIWVWLGTVPPGDFATIFVTDAEVDYTTYSQLSDTGSVSVQYQDDNTGGRVLVSSVSTIALGGWVNLISTVKMNLGADSNLAQLLSQGIDIGQIDINGNAVSMQFNGKSFTIGDDGFGAPFIGYMADVWIAPGQSLLTGSTIAAPTIAKFISGGKPVDLGSDGSTPTGTAPAIFLRRAPAAAASTFATNLGTGGDFTITGSLSSSPSSPSD